MKSVWITGASSGIGLTLAKQLADSGWQVLASARNEDSLLALEHYNTNIQALPADVTRDDDLETLKTFFSLRDKPLDAVVVNAGSCEYMLDARLDMDSMRRVFEINVFGAVATIDIALPYLKRARGQIVGVSSMSVYLPFTRAEYYGASKAAFSYYLQSLRVDLKPSAVAVSEIYPGFVKTPLTEKNDFAMPFSIPAEKAAAEIAKVMQGRSVRHAFPRPMHYLLKAFSLCPPLWRLVHKPRMVASS